METPKIVDSDFDDLIQRRLRNFVTAQTLVNRYILGYVCIFIFPVKAALNHGGFIYM